MSEEDKPRWDGTSSKKEGQDKPADRTPTVDELRMHIEELAATNRTLTEKNRLMFEYIHKRCEKLESRGITIVQDQSGYVFTPHLKLRPFQSRVRCLEFAEQVEQQLGVMLDVKSDVKVDDDG